ncbi:response regulator [Leptolyngbya sp. AN03gr2]|uniref:response regulator n=1 Tax=unclassified Leptolyngbya TaxID=2650499 RepID=UPI003D317EA4
MPSPIPTLLVVEDSDEDFATLQRVLKQIPTSYSIFRCTSGDEALAFLYRTEEPADRSTPPRPSIILLDLNLPGTDGLNVLATIKQDKKLKEIPVVVMSGFDDPQEVQRCYRYGVNSYIKKSFNTQEFVSTLKAFISYWLQSAVFPNIA